ncbi:MAG: AraC family transcriptional regulator [Planctomycetota bacterium]
MANISLASSALKKRNEIAESGRPITISRYAQVAYDGKEVVELREPPGSLIQVVSSRHNRVASLPATPNLEITMQVDGASMCEVDLGFGNVYCDWPTSGYFVVQPPDLPFTVNRSESEDFGLLTLALPWASLRDQAEQTVQRELPNLGGELHGRYHRDAHTQMLMHQIWMELAAGQPWGELMAESLSTAIVGRLLQLAEVPLPELAGARSQNKLSSSSMRRVKEYIHERLERKIMLDELAELSAVSKFHFARLFKNTTGKTPHQYVMEQRIERAKQLLRDDTFGDQGIAPIAMACGFSDQSHLGRHFKRLVGVTPATYRRAARGSRP